MSASSLLGAARESESEPVVGVFAASTRLWRLGMICGCFTLAAWESADMSIAFYRTLEDCPLPFPDSVGQCPVGSLNVGGRCEQVDRTSADWSGSLTCVAKNDVMNRATGLAGYVNATSSAAGLILSIIVGAGMIDTMGRKLVLMLCLWSLLLRLILTTSSAFVGGGPAARWVLLLAALLGSLQEAARPASMAMAADVMPKDEASRSSAYSYLSIITHVGAVVAYTVGFFILRMCLTNYIVVWLVLTGGTLLLIGLASQILRETRAVGEKAPLLSRDDGLEKGLSRIGSGPVALIASIADELWVAVELVWTDRFLRYSLVSQMLDMMCVTGGITISASFAMQAANLTQSVASLAGVFQPLCVIIGAGVASRTVPYAGAYYTHYIAKALVVCGFIVTALAAIYPEHSGALFFCGWPVITGLGFGAVLPSGQTMYSLRAPSEQHGKLFTVFCLAGGVNTGVGGIIGNAVWANSLFDAHAVAWRLGSPYLIGAVLLLASLVVNLVLYAVYILPGMRSGAAGDHAGEPAEAIT